MGAYDIPSFEWDPESPTSGKISCSCRWITQTILPSRAGCGDRQDDGRPIGRNFVVGNTDRDLDAAGDERSQRIEPRRGYDPRTGKELWNSVRSKTTAHPVMARLLR